MNFISRSILFFVMFCLTVPMFAEGDVILRNVFNKSDTVKHFIFSGTKNPHPVFHMGPGLIGYERLAPHEKKTMNLVLNPEESKLVVKDLNGKNLMEYVPSGKDPEIDVYISDVEGIVVPAGEAPEGAKS